MPERLRQIRPAHVNNAIFRQPNSPSRISVGSSRPWIFGAENSFLPPSVLRRNGIDGTHAWFISFSSRAFRPSCFLVELSISYATKPARQTRDFDHIKEASNLHSNCKKKADELEKFTATTPCYLATSQHRTTVSNLESRYALNAKNA